MQIDRLKKIQQTFHQTLEYPFECSVEFTSIRSVRHQQCKKASDNHPRWNPAISISMCTVEKSSCISMKSFQWNHFIEFINELPNELVTHQCSTQIHTQLNSTQVKGFPLNYEMSFECFNSLMTRAWNAANQVNQLPSEWVRVNQQFWFKFGFKSCEK